MRPRATASDEVGTVRRPSRFEPERVSSTEHLARLRTTSGQLRFICYMKANLVKDDGDAAKQHRVDHAGAHARVPCEKMRPSAGLQQKAWVGILLTDRVQAEDGASIERRNGLPEFHRER